MRIGELRAAKRAASRQDRHPPYRIAGACSLVLLAVVVLLTYGQFRGEFTPTVRVTMMAGRSGLMLDVGSKVTYNGVPIGRVISVQPSNESEFTSAQITLAVDPKYVDVIPANAVARVEAGTVFGAKHVSMSAPQSPVAQRMSSSVVLHESSVTTELNTLFENVVSVAQKVDPVKLNTTLTAAAEAIDGLGNRFGQSVEHGNTILGDINPQMSSIREDFERFADLADVYTDAVPDLFDGLNNAVVTSRTITDQQGALDSALLASVGFGNTAGEVFEKSAPYLIRGAADSIPTSRLFDEYSPEILCTIRNYYDLEPLVAKGVGGNGYSLQGLSELMGAGNPYVYPDNLPRVNARGGPEGRPGCWQKITRELWPAPYLVMDTGASIAPYNHFGLGQPLLTDYVWGRQVGEYTINP